MDADALLEGLNRAQRAAVTATSSPLCILAGAGSGKTRVLTRRIAWRAATGDLDPRHVLALTFTRKAAGELTERLRSLGLRDRLAAGTFHSVAYAQLRSRWADRGIEPPSLLDRKVGFVARVMPASTRDVPPIDVVAEIEWAKARMVDPDRYAEAAVAAGRRPPLDPAEVARIFARYEEARRERRLVDFDDLLRVCRRDLLRDPEFAATQRWRFQHLFVDEFQDVNPLQQALLDAWRGDRLDLCIVGDPNQAIYAWNGADPEALRRFPSRFPDAEVVRLTENYRSSPQVLAVANAVLLGGGRGVDRDGALQATRPDGPVPTIHSYDDAKAEAHGIARAVRDHHAPGATWSAQAVLVRTNAQIPAVEEALTKAQIPFRVRGAAPLLDQPEVKAALGGLRRARGTFDEALADLASSIDEAVGTGDRAEERRANVDALVQLARDYATVEGTATIPGFLSWLSSTTRADQPDRQGDAVEITTFHAAKGLEWPIVHLAGLEQGLVPIGHARTGEALAEELRLFYVAVTRAERELVCSWAASRRYGTRDLRRERSPYLDTLAAACTALRAGTDPAEVGRGAGQVDPVPKAARAKKERPHRRSRTRPDLPRAAGALAPTDLDDEGRALLDSLRTWRTEKARAAGMPPYVICNDRTLIEIASVRPSTPAQLLTVHGLGEVKVGRFGEELLALVGDAASSVDFRARNTFAASLDEVVEAYADPDLAPSLGALAPLSAGEVLDHRRRLDRVEVHVRYAYRGDLPPGAGAVVDPSRLTWVQVTELDLGRRSASVVLKPDHYPDRLRATALERFEAAASGGTDRTVEGELGVKLLVGGRAVERALVSGLQEWLANEAAAVDRWITDGMPTPPELDDD